MYKLHSIFFKSHSYYRYFVFLFFAINCIKKNHIYFSNILSNLIKPLQFYDKLFYFFQTKYEFFSIFSTFQKPKTYINDGENVFVEADLTGSNASMIEIKYVIRDINEHCGILFNLCFKVQIGINYKQYFTICKNLLVQSKNRLSLLRFIFCEHKITKI